MQGNGLSRMKFPANRGISVVPSWSWMAYKGSIQYLKLQFDGFEWLDVESPWSSSALQAARTEGHTPGLALRAKAQNYDFNPTVYVPGANMQSEGLLYFDNPGGTSQPKTACVVLGIEKEGQSLAEKQHYVIIIAERTQDRSANKVYERVGAGYLVGKHIDSVRFSVTIC